MLSQCHGGLERWLVQHLRLLLGRSETTQPRTPSCGGCAKIQRHLSAFLLGVSFSPESRAR